MCSVWVGGSQNFNLPERLPALALRQAGRLAVGRPLTSLTGSGTETRATDPRPACRRRRLGHDFPSQHCESPKDVGSREGTKVFGEIPWRLGLLEILFGN